MIVSFSFHSNRNCESAAIKKQSGGDTNDDDYYEDEYGDYEDEGDLLEQHKVVAPTITTTTARSTTRSTTVEVMQGIDTSE